MIASVNGHPAICDVVDDPDAKLMLRAKAGDHSALEELTIRYRPRVAGAVTRLMGHDRHSEDLTQEVFLRVYLARNTYVVTAKFSTWLFTIVRNVVSNARRYFARRRERTGNGADGSMPDPLRDLRAETPYETPIQAAMRGEDRRLVRTAIARLPARQRIAVSLYYFQGLNYEATARALDTSQDALKSLLRRARVNIQQSLTPHMDDVVKC